MGPRSVGRTAPGADPDQRLGSVETLLGGRGGRLGRRLRSGQGGPDHLVLVLGVGCVVRGLVVWKGFAVLVVLWYVALIRKKFVCS